MGEKTLSRWRIILPNESERRVFAWIKMKNVKSWNMGLRNGIWAVKTSFWWGEETRLGQEERLLFAWGKTESQFCTWDLQGFILIAFAVATCSCSFPADGQNDGPEENCLISIAPAVPFYLLLPNPLIY